MNINARNKLSRRKMVYLLIQHLLISVATIAEAAV